LIASAFAQIGQTLMFAAYLENKFPDFEEAISITTLVRLIDMSNESQLKSYLAKHLNFLVKSSAAFDKGETDEAIRMAVSMRVLLHDTKNSTSLLKLLNAKDIFLTSTCEEIPPSVVISSGSMFYYRVEMTAGGPKTIVKPCLDDGPPIGRHHLKADQWWNQIIFVLSHGSDPRVSRRDIVLVAANKDGGAHVDPDLTPQYESLKQPGGTWTSVQYKVGDAERTFQFENIHEVLIRQMAYELLNSSALLALIKP
jgi:hypothetical protein